MRFRIRARWAYGSVESIVDGPAELRERRRAFRAIPGLVELREETYEGSERCGTWLDLLVPMGAGR